MAYEGYRNLHEACSAAWNRWRKHPRKHFRPQADGDLVEDGVCGMLIAQKLGVSQPTASEHLKNLLRPGLVRAKRIKQWTFYKRDETSIRKVKQMIEERVLARSTCVPKKATPEGTGSTGENEPSGLSTGNAV